MNYALILVAVAIVTVACVAQAGSKSGKATPAKEAVTESRPSPIHTFDVKRIDGSATKLDAWKGQVVLIVNVASKCGLTPQYTALEKLHEKYAAKGFAVLGFPANNFGRQEPGSNQEIVEFCKSKYSVTFPMFEKVSVKGNDQVPLYRYLTKESPFPGEVSWNFEKYLVDGAGNVIAHFDPKVTPDDPKVTAAIEAALGAKTATSQPKPKS